ncbi:MAG: hypothetical protein LC732_04875 [Acidobacteria bacterium]|nr:hypothetical protein [Acidobacteriota bacterium]
MRLAVVLAFVTLFVSAPASSQPRPGRMPMNVQISSLDQLQGASEEAAARLQLDAFVSTRLAAAVADLEDFRTAAAIAKARGRIEEARLRTVQTRGANPRILQILSSAREILDRADRNSGAVDLPGVQKELLRESARLQRILYADLDEAQRVRKAMSEIQKKVNMMAEGLDAALEEALGAMFAYLRSGGA